MQRPHWDIAVRFAYEITGMRYSAEQRWYTASNDETSVKAEERDYPRGAKVLVHYDPANPAKAVIKPMARTIREDDYEFNAVLIGSLLTPAMVGLLIWRQPIVTKIKAVPKMVAKWRHAQ